MRIGLCINTAAQDAEGIGDGHIVPAAAMGFDYLELPLAQMMALSAAEFRRRVLRPLAGSGITAEACNNFFPASHRLTGPSADHGSALEYARAALDRAAELSVARVVFGSGGARNLPDGFSRADGLAQLTELLVRIGPMARERGITIAIEPLNRLESNSVNRLEDVVALAKAVGDASVAALADWYHMAMGYEPMAHFELARGTLVHMHIARTLGRGMPAPGDLEPYDALFAALEEIGYDQRISIEALPRADFLSEAGAALKLLRQYC